MIAKREYWDRGIYWVLSPQLGIWHPNSDHGPRMGITERLGGTYHAIYDASNTYDP